MISGVFRAMRRRSLSGAALVCGMATVGGTLVMIPRAIASEQSFFAHAVKAIENFERQEIAALTTAAGVLGFSVVAAFLLMRTRSRALKVESRLRSENQRLQIESDRYRALLFAEPQILISWPAGGDLPDISGDVAIVMPQGAQPPATQRVLAFGTWLQPEQALEMDHAVDALREKGEGFLLHHRTSSGRLIEAMGRAVGGQAILRIRELSGLRMELAEANASYKALIEETAALRAFAAEMPSPLWTRNSNGMLSFANAAFAQAADAATAADAIKNNLDVLDRADREAMEQTLASGKPFNARLPLIIGGQRRMFDIHAANVGDGHAGIAVDASEAAALGAALVRMAEAQRRILDQLTSGVAVFDARRRLAFYNDSYRRLWDLDPAFLDTNPDDTTVLEKLRAARKIAEQPDFRAWRNKLHEAYQAVETKKDIWYLPDGRAVSIVTTPNPEGGVTYLFDDVTEGLTLQRQNDGLMRVQRETLDNLAEAVAVFGGNGRVQLFNPPFARMWKLAPEALMQQPHIEAVEQLCRPLFDDPNGWQILKTAITGIENREAVPLRMERRDGSVLDCTTLPLPDGATMLTFQDVTDSVNVERALRERNEALETADQMKVDFVHHVSYELRSPLTTIIGFAHLLSDPSTAPMTPKQSEYLSYITASTNALLAIINNILDLATIDAGAMTLALGPVDVRKTVEEAAAGIQDRLVRDQITLDVTIDPAIDHFIADERRVVQVLFNLLANAAGFSPQGASIGISVTQTRDRVLYSVTDSGPGIPADVKDKVFGLFESHANGSRHRGAGLGLSLVRSFVELHGGTIEVNSVVGEGTTVICAFPIDQAAGRTAAA